MGWRVVRMLSATVLLSLLSAFLLVTIMSSITRVLTVGDIPATKYFALSETFVEQPNAKGYDAVGQELQVEQEYTLRSQSVPIVPSKSSVVRIEHKRDLPNQPVIVLLLSSTPRSGSSFVGELLATHNASVYFFEPMHKLRNTSCIKSNECVSRYLKDKFQCRIDDAFSKWLKAKSLFFGFYNEEARRCEAKPKKKKVPCLKSFNMTQACQDSRVRLVKVIRARLSQVESLLADESLNMKIIHLYRDPRGFMNSINKFKDWNKDPNYYCSGVRDDLLYSISLHERYPSQLLQIPYERISQNPVEYAKLMFNFAFGSLTLPPETEHYLATHTEETKQDTSKNAMTRTKDSRKAYQAWRDNISSSLLQAVESNVNCRDSINLIKHRLFGDIKSVRNKNISMFIDN